MLRKTLLTGVMIAICVVLLLSCFHGNYHYERLLEAIHDQNMKKFSKELKYVNNLDVSPSNAAKIFFTDRYDETPLQAACYVGNLEMVQNLVRKGADPDYVVKKVAPVSPLMCVVQGDQNNPDARYLEIGKFLIEHGADVNYRMAEDGSLGVTALFQIVDCRQPSPNAEELIQLFCENGADINEMTPYGTVMHCVCQYGHDDLIRYLINNYPVDLNLQQDDSGETCLMYYSRNHANPDIAEVLLQAGADPFIRDSQGKTAYDYATEEGHEQVARAVRDAMQR